MTVEPEVAIDAGSAARSELYGLLADAWAFPEREFHTRVESGFFRDQVEELVSQLPYRLPDSAALAGLSDTGEYLDFQGEYMRLFDVGTVRPPCPLYGGEWGMTRKRTMEETLRFYRYFGMKVDEDARELPDHVTVELEFLQVLAFEEGMARATGQNEGPFLRAQRDFIERHPGKWWPLLQKKLAPQSPSRFYEALTALTGAFLAADLAHIRGLLS